MYSSGMPIVFRIGAYRDCCQVLVLVTLLTWALKAMVYLPPILMAHSA